MDLILAVCVGVALAAASGLRIFLPMLVASASIAAGWAEPSADMAWLGSTPALAALTLAAVLEVGAMHVPWLDNALDAIGAPLAVVAGTLASASLVTDVDPMLLWTLALIGGGGTAGGVHTLAAGTRAASTVLTGGLANPLITMAETAMAFLVAVLAVVAPVVAVLLMAALIVVAVRRLRANASQPTS